MVYNLHCEKNVKIEHSYEGIFSIIVLKVVLCCDLALWAMFVKQIQIKITSTFSVIYLSIVYVLKVKHPLVGVKTCFLITSDHNCKSKQLKHNNVNFLQTQQCIEKF